VTPLERIRIEKAAADCGFEREAVLKDDGQLELRSATFPEVVWVRVATPFGFQLTASLPSLLTTGSGDGELLVEGIEQLYQALQQVAATARNMPNRVADLFRTKTQNLPKTTDAERLVVQRVGQNLFRNALLDFWQGRCCVTGLAVPSLLRASHIKPWSKCVSDNERLDVFNGLLLAPHLDALFDGGWVSFSDQGGLMVSKQLSATARTQLGVTIGWTIQGLGAAHMGYLAHHREHEFRHG
jgi:putative restriction endonuclease